MSRPFTFLAPCLFLWSCLVVFSSAPPAQAFTTYDLTANTTQAYLVSNFSIQYIDKDGDAKLGLSDYVFFFSGVTFNNVDYPELLTIPVNSKDSPYTNGNADDHFWAFKPAEGDTEHLNPVLWTYDQAAQYITYDLTAYTKSPNIISDFMVQYVDRDGDKRVGPNDLVFDFSGVTINGEVFSKLTAIPRYSADVSPYTNGPDTVFSWQFKSSSGDIQNFVEWDFTYGQTPVPLPPSALLLGTGLISLVWVRRQKYK